MGGRDFSKCDTAGNFQGAEENEKVSAARRNRTCGEYFQQSQNYVGGVRSDDNDGMESWEHYVGLNWTDRFNDPPKDTREKLKVNFFVDASELDDENFDKIINEVEELGRLGESWQRDSDFSWDYFYKDDEEETMVFTIRGWAIEWIYNDLCKCLGKYNVKVSEFA